MWSPPDESSSPCSGSPGGPGGIMETRKEFPPKKPSKRGRKAMSREEFADQYREILDRLFGDENVTLQQVGEEFGITRERVRQIAERARPFAYHLRKEQKKARTAKRNAEEGQRRRGSCNLCGALNPKGATAYCCSEHRQIFLHHFRYQVDYNGAHDLTRKAQMNWVLNHPDEVNEIMLADAQRRVSDGPVGAKNLGKRWIVRGSKTWMYAQQAYREGWPVFEQLHPDVQEQVKTAIEAQDFIEEEGLL